MPSESRPRLALAIALVAFVTSMSWTAVRADEDDHNESRHYLGGKVGVTLIPEGESDPGDSFVVAPTVGLEYEYEFSHVWAVACMADIETAKYTIGSLTREYLFIVAAAAVYSVVPRVFVYLGPGYEFERNESFFVIRLGAGYRFGLESGWRIAPGIEIDFKEAEYASIFVGVSVGK